MSEWFCLHPSMYMYSPHAFGVAQSRTLSVSLGIDACRDDFWVEARSPCELTKRRCEFMMVVSTNSLRQLARDCEPPACLVAACRAALYRRFEIHWASKHSGALQDAILRYGRLQICATL